MNKVLVKKAVSAQYPVGAGAPVMVLGGGGGGAARGRTKRERGLGMLGGAVGVLGALAGQHRSLGGLAQSAISGGAQGRQLGAGLGRFLTGRERQARADLDEKTHQQFAEAKAGGRIKGDYGTDWSLGYHTPVGVKRKVLSDAAQREAQAKEQARQQRAEEIAAAKARGSQFGAEDREYAEAARRFVEQVGVSPQEFASGLGRMGAAAKKPVDLEQGPDGTYSAGGDVKVKPAVTTNVNVDIKDSQVGSDENTQNMFRTVQNNKAKRKGRPLPFPNHVPKGETSELVADIGHAKNVTNAAGENVGNVQQAAASPVNNRIGLSPPGSVGSNNETADRVGQGITDAQGFDTDTEGEPSDTQHPPIQGGTGMTDPERDFYARMKLQQRRDEMKVQPPQGNQPTLFDTESMEPNY